MMKNRKLNLTFASALLLLPLTLTACGPESMPSYEPGKEDLNAIIALFEKGFTMNGTITQSRLVVDLNNPSDMQSDTQDIRVEALYENGDRIGTSITQYNHIGDFETVVAQNVAYADDEGYAYNEYLDYKNEVQRKYFNDYGNKVTFAAAGLYNFWNTFDASDFTYDGENKVYEVDLSKIGLALKNMFSQNINGFLYKPASATISVKDNLFYELNVVMTDHKTIEAQENKMVGTTYSNSLKATFSDVGVTKLPRVTKVEAKAENAELHKALAKVKDNFTIDLDKQVSVNGGAVSKKLQMYKFDGEKILIQNYKDSIERDLLTKENHYVLRTLEGSASDKLYSYIMINEDGEYEKGDFKDFASNFQGIYYYDQLIPHPSIISTDFFTYDADVNEFVCNDYDIAQQIVPCLSINYRPLSDDNVSNSGKVGIRLNDNGDLDYIKFYINYKDMMNGSDNKGFVKASFSEIGSTTI